MDVAVVDGAQGRVLVPLQKVVSVTQADFSVPSDGSPWKERGDDVLAASGLVGLNTRFLVCWAF